MDLALIALALVCVVVNNALWLKELNKREAAHQMERRELQNRIQRPEMILPVSVEPSAPDEVPVTEEADDEYDLVGVVQANA